MKDLAARMSELEGKARLMRKRLTDLDLELKASLAKNEELETKIQLYKLKINDLTNRNKIQKVIGDLNQQGGSTKNSKASRKVIESLIEEIDRCITLLDR